MPGQRRPAAGYLGLLGDRALITVFLVSFSGAAGANAVPVALPEVATAFALSDAQLGLVMTAFFLPTILLIPLIGILADTFGRRPILLPSLIVFSVAGAATTLVDSYPVLLALRVLQGTAFAGTLPFTPTLIGDLYTGAQGSTAQGLRSSVNGIANTVTPVVAGFLAALSWSYPFLLMVSTLPVAVVVYRYYPEPVTDPGTGSGSVIDEIGSYASAIRAETADLVFPVLAGGGFALFFVKLGVVTFVPVYVVRVLGEDVTTAGFILGAYGVTRIVIAPGAGPVTARFGRQLPIVGGFILIAVGAAAIPFTPSAAVLVGAIVVYGAGEAILNPVLTDAVAAYASDERRAGIMSGLQTLKHLAITLSPAILGLVLTASDFLTTFLVAAAFPGVYAIVVAVVLDRET